MSTCNVTLANNADNRNFHIEITKQEDIAFVLFKQSMIWKVQVVCSVHFGTKCEKVLHVSLVYGYLLG